MEVVFAGARGGEGGGGAWWQVFFLRVALGRHARVCSGGCLNVAGGSYHCAACLAVAWRPTRGDCLLAACGRASLCAVRAQVLVFGLGLVLSNVDDAWRRTRKAW